MVWRGDFENFEVHDLHAEAFRTRVFDESEWNYRNLAQTHSLGWVTARSDRRLVGFANVLWDGRTHAWIQDVMVGARVRRQGIGRAVVDAAAEGARGAGCEWLHVDFETELRSFYFGACGFSPTDAGLMRL
jgi:GNAT superfamily N-acetyltransferase